MSIWIPCVQAYLHAGDFVLASPQEGAVPLVGRIMGGSTVNGIQVTWWLSRNELLQIAGIEAVPLLSAQTHRNVQLCKIVEVTERVLSISEISTNLVTDLAFVFHAHWKVGIICCIDFMFVAPFLWNIAVVKPRKGCTVTCPFHRVPVGLH